MSYRQPAMIRNQAGLNAANEAIEKFNDSLSGMADDFSDMKQRQYCRENSSAAECKSKSDKDDDDDSNDGNNNSNTNQGNTTSTTTSKNIQSNSKAAITSQIKTPTKVKRGGAQTGGSIQYFSNDMENDMYDNYKKSNYNSSNSFGTPAGSNKKNNYKTFYNGED